MIRRTVFATDNESSRYALGGVLLEIRPTRSSPSAPTAAAWPRWKAPPIASAGTSRGDSMTIVPDRGDAADRAGARPTPTPKIQTRRPRQRRAGAQPAGHDLLAAGRRPLSPLARRVSRSARRRRRSSSPVGPLYSAVRQAAIVTSEESRGVDFTFDDGTLVLSGRAAEVGQSRVEMPIAYDGPAIIDHARPAVT